MTQKEDNERLDFLAKSLGSFLNGWDTHDVASVCALVTAFALATAPLELAARRKNLETIIKFMRDSFERALMENASVAE